MTTVDIRTFTRHTPVSGFAFSKVATEVLPNWEISLVFAGETRAKSLNYSLRKKTYTPNVLSYESGTRSGEIIICLPIAKKQAQSYGVSYKQFVIFLFIHGLLHLKGLPHGTTMERYEKKYLQRFAGVAVDYGTTHRDRD